jgi:hypothetical protein
MNLIFVHNHAIIISYFLFVALCALFYVPNSLKNHSDMIKNNPPPFNIIYDKIFCITGIILTSFLVPLIILIMVPYYVILRLYAKKT